MAGIAKGRLKVMEKMLPKPEYGEYHGSPLWSLRQVNLVMGFWKWADIWLNDGDKFAAGQMKARLGICWKEWKDGNRERLRNGNHRNARWNAHRFFGAG
jgi:hypothetical protein